MMSIDDLLRSIRVDGLAPGYLEITRTGGALFVSRRPTIHLIIEGSGVLDIPSTGDAVEFAPGDALLLPHGFVNRMRVSDDLPATSSDFATQMDEYSSILAYRFGNGETAIKTLTMIFDLHHARANPMIRMLPNIIKSRLLPPEMLADQLSYVGAAAFAERLGDLALIELIRRYARDTGATSRISGAGVSFAPVERAVAAIQADLSRDWSLIAMAKEAGMSRSTFAAAFAQHIGEAPMHYLTRIRLVKAAEILRTTNLDAGAVATQVGYQSGASLTRAFSRFFGTPPGQYRRQIREEMSSVS